MAELDDELIPLYPVECASCRKRVAYCDERIPSLAHPIVMLCEWCMTHIDEVEKRLLDE